MADEFDQGSDQVQEIEIHSKSICYVCKNSMLVYGEGPDPRFAQPGVIGPRISTTSALCIKYGSPSMVSATVGLTLGLPPHFPLEVKACQGWEPDFNKLLASPEADTGHKVVVQ